MAVQIAWGWLMPAVLAVWAASLPAHARGGIAQTLENAAVRELERRWEESQPSVGRADAGAIGPVGQLPTRSLCPGAYADGLAPRVLNAKLLLGAREMCSSTFAVFYSSRARAPLWVASTLTKDSVNAAATQDRIDSFHPDTRLAPVDRAELVDFRASANGGLSCDRGHMFPNSDAPGRQSQYESFALTNIVCQDGDNNRNIWASIEKTTRNIARCLGRVQVITGPLFLGDSLVQLNRRVLVPSHLFKLVYDPVRHRAGAYVTPNAPGRAWQAVSAAQLSQWVGADLLPGDPRAATVAAPLPAPLDRTRRARDEDGSAEYICNSPAMRAFAGV